MKVAVLALPRTSSSSLYSTIKLLYKFDINRSEPFNKEFHYNDFVDFNAPVNISTKLIYSRYFLPPGIENLDDFLIWIKNTFTHVICLYREDTILQSFSLLYHLKIPKHNWHVPIIADTKLLDPKEIENLSLSFDSEIKILKKYSEDNNFLLVRYEDLIINEGNNQSFKNICNYINVDFDYNKIYKWYKKENKVTLRREDIKIDKLI